MYRYSSREFDAFTVEIADLATPMLEVDAIGPFRIGAIELYQSGCLRGFLGVWPSRDMSTQAGTPK